MAILDVIIPVGPGHEEIVNHAINSVRIAEEDKGLFTSVQVKPIDDTQATLGRSKARNYAVQRSEADWLFFLDADDLMHPDALQTMSGYMSFDAVWGRICEFHNHCIIDRFQVPQINSYEQLIRHEPFQTLQMGHFVKTEIAKKYPFDEEMNCGEDWKYYLQVWRNHRCIKQREPLMVNRRGFHSKGPKSANGREWSQVVGKMVLDERKKLHA